MKVYLFKVRDYTTTLVGQYVEPVYSESKHESRDGYFFVQRGDGTKYEYDDTRIEWSKFLGGYHEAALQNH